MENRIIYSAPDESGEATYILKAGGKEAFLNFSKEENGYRFEYLRSHIHKASSRLIKKFCTDVGPGQFVCGVITNKETQDQLVDLGCIRDIHDKKKDIEVSDDDGKRLRMWHILNDGGLNNVRFALEYDPASPSLDYYNCVFTAYT